MTKVYFDSSNRTSGSNTDMRWSTPGGQTLRTSENAYVAVADFQSPHSFYNVQACISNIFYFRTKGLSHPHPLTDHSLAVAEGNYTLTTLCAALQTLLNNLGNGATYAVTPNTSQARVNLTESNGGGFMVPSAVWLAFKPWNGQQLANPPSIGKILNVPDPADVAMSGIYTVSWQSGVVHLLRLSSLYVRIPELAGSTIDAGGRRNVARRIPITSEFSEVLNGQDDQSKDFLPCSNQSISSLTIQLTDENAVPLRMDSSWSMSLVFSEEPF